MQIKSVTLPYDKRHKFNFLIDTTMTQKEKLYFEYLEIQNSIYAVKGETDKQINLDEFSKKGRFMAVARNSVVYDLQKSIKYAKQQLERYQFEAERDAWFKTAEGAQWKQDKEAQMQSIREQEMELLERARQYASVTVQQVIGAHFDVTSFGESSMTIGLVKEYKDGKPVALFGHTFEVFFERDYFKKELRWELNYPTMGGFDLNEENNTRTQYLVGLAKFASNKTLVPSLRDFLHGFGKSMSTLFLAYCDAERELKNPSVLADNNE